MFFGVPRFIFEIAPPARTLSDTAPVTVNPSMVPVCNSRFAPAVSSVPVAPSAVTMLARCAPLPTSPEMLAPKPPVTARPEISCCSSTPSRSVSVRKTIALPAVMVSFTASPASSFLLPFVSKTSLSPVASSTAASLNAKVFAFCSSAESPASVAGEPSLKTEKPPDWTRNVAGAIRCSRISTRVKNDVRWNGLAIHRR